MGYIELAQAVNELGMSERTIRRRIEIGDLNGCKRGRKWWIAQDDHYNQFISSAPEPPTGLTSPEQFAKSTTVTSLDRSGAIRDVDSVAVAMPLRADGGTGIEPERVFDSIDHGFGVGRLASWKKLRQLYVLCHANELHEACSLCHEAMAILLDGYLGYGSTKIESYRQCRRLLCCLIVNLHGTNIGQAGNSKLTDAAQETLSAIQSLIIRLSRKKGKERPEHYPDKNVE